jgi:hypothetical protein
MESVDRPTEWLSVWCVVFIALPILPVSHLLIPFVHIYIYLEEIGGLDGRRRRPKYDLQVAEVVVAAVGGIDQPAVGSCGVACGLG